VNCKLAVTDQFGDKAYVLNALMKRGRTIELIQRPKAEEDLAVAAASILARAEFLKRLYFLSQDIGIELPKGASSLVEEAGLELVKAQGAQALDKVAKRHFKITARILSSV
jgi:ribonuclease HIII